MFRKFIVIRHGNYDYFTMDLDATGERQIRKLLPIIKEHTAGVTNIILLSSNALRAESSIKIISGELNLPYEVSEYLWCDDDYPQDNRRALNFILHEVNQKEADMVIILTHLEYANELPGIMINHLGEQIFVENSLSKGEMVVVDLSDEKSFYYHQ